MKQKLESLLRSDIIEANKVLWEVKGLKAILAFEMPEHINYIDLCSLSDASDSNTNDTYGQTGIPSWLEIGGHGPATYHTVMYSSRKERITSYSSFGAKDTGRSGS